MNTDRHVATHVQSDCVLEKLGEASGEIVVARNRAPANIPVSRLLIIGAFDRIREAGCRRKLPNAAKKSVLGFVQPSFDQKRSGDCVVELILVVAGCAY